MKKQGVQASFRQPDREKRKARPKAVLEVLTLRALPRLAQAAACLAAGQAPEGPFGAVIKLHDHRPAVYRQDGLNRCLGQIGYILLGELGACYDCPAAGIAEQFHAFCVPGRNAGTGQKLPGQICSQLAGVVKHEGQACAIRHLHKQAQGGIACLPWQTEKVIIAERFAVFSEGRGRIILRAVEKMPHTEFSEGFYQVYAAASDIEGGFLRRITDMRFMP